MFEKTINKNVYYLSITSTIERPWRKCRGAVENGLGITTRMRVCVCVRAMRAGNDDNNYGYILRLPRVKRIPRIPPRLRCLSAEYRSRYRIRGIPAAGRRRALGGGWYDARAHAV